MNDIIQMVDRNGYKETSKYVNIVDTYLEMLKNGSEIKYELLENEWEKSLFFNEMSYGYKNIISWIGIKATDSVLEVNSRLGGGTKYLLEQSKKVTCIDSSIKESQVNAIINKNINKIYVGNIISCLNELDELYDLIVIWELREEQFIDVVKKLKKSLKTNGRIYIFCSNKYGIKRMSSIRKKYNGQHLYFDSKEGIAKEKILQSLMEMGDTNVDIYYPYPDFRYTMSVYSDDWLPHIGELNKNNYNFYPEYIDLVDDGTLYNEIIKDGKFEELSNSYLFVLKGK